MSHYECDVCGSDLRGDEPTCPECIVGKPEEVRQ